MDSDNESDGEDKIGVIRRRTAHGEQKTVLSEQTFRIIVLALLLVILVAGILAFIFSLLTWLEATGEIDILAAFSLWFSGMAKEQLSNAKAS